MIASGAKMVLVLVAIFLVLKGGKKYEPALPFQYYLPLISV
jgi:hypothetical protein